MSYARFINVYSRNQLYCNIKDIFSTLITLVLMISTEESIGEFATNKACLIFKNLNFDQF